MKLNILKIEDDQIFYTDVEEERPELYKLSVSAAMVCDVNPYFNSNSVSDAPVLYMANVMVAYHCIKAEKMPEMDLSKIAGNKFFAPLANQVYKSRLTA